MSCLCHRAGNAKAVCADSVSCSGFGLGLPWCCCLPRYHSTRPADPVQPLSPLFFPPPQGPAVSDGGKAALCPGTGGRHHLQGRGKPTGSLVPGAGSQQTVRSCVSTGCAMGRGQGRAEPSAWDWPCPHIPPTWPLVPVPPFGCSAGTLGCWGLSGFLGQGEPGYQPAPDSLRESICLSVSLTVHWTSQMVYLTVSAPVTRGLDHQEDKWGAWQRSSLTHLLHSCQLCQESTASIPLPSLANDPLLPAAHQSNQFQSWGCPRELPSF